MMRTFIKATLPVKGMHHWKDATPHRKYLADPHRHTFYVSVSIPVKEDDREVEFHDLLFRIASVIQPPFISVMDDGVIDFGGRSCEMIAKHVLSEIPEAAAVTVSEDNESEATVINNEDRPKVLTVCGSTRFKEQHLEAFLALERLNIATFQVGGFMHSDEINVSREEKAAFDRLHKAKIAMSDGIYVVNPGDYIGDSTKGEIEHAAELGKEIFSMNPLKVETDGKVILSKPLVAINSPRESVRTFARAMEVKLRKNDHKPGWSETDPAVLVEWLNEEMLELHGALNARPPEEIKEEAVDLANVAMMIYERAEAWR